MPFAKAFAPLGYNILEGHTLKIKSVADVLNLRYGKTEFIAY